MTMAVVWASLGSVSAVLLDMALVWSLIRPDERFWPPPDGRIGTRAYAIWALSIVPFVAGGIAGLLDMQPTPTFVRMGGALAMALGSALVGWGIATLSWAQALGEPRALVTHGPYRFTRNPQYLGDLALLVGFVVFTGSSLALAVAIPVALALVLFPWTEEPWLASRFGEPYVTYCRRVPRFLGWRRWHANADSI